MAIDLSTCDCPGCHKPIRIEDPVATRDVECPGCGKHWAVRMLDVPGSRFVVRLTQPGA